ncbi:MAG TPA: N-acyl homoserine lactonase family protein [Solirubrobacteraceae bacterium]|nr:N-acyl homoserine lactonase family protein [Solirubrobacteraceae bacterium]
MEIHALTTGTVRIKTAMARGRGRGPVRFARTLLDRSYTDELPIHAWLIEHPEGPILVDAGELAETADPPIAHFAVTQEHEIDRQLAAIGVGPADLRRVVLTHLHGDHMNGVARLPGVEVVAGAEALTRGGVRALARLGVAATALSLDGRAFGPFARSAPLTADGRVIAVPIPGHARGQIAVVVLEDECDVMIAGDSAYNEQQLLDLHVDGVSLSARQAIDSMRRIIEHARRQPTVYLPSHDPGAARRLASRIPLSVA